MAEHQLSSLSACIHELLIKLEEVENRFRGTEGGADLRTDPASRQGIDKGYNVSMRGTKAGEIET